MLDPAGIPRFQTTDWKLRVIDDRYRVAHVLARNDRTTILVATDAEDEDYVLKVVRHDGNDNRFLQIIREYDILRDINHPYVVRAHRVLDIDERHAAIVMNRAPGRNLQTLLRDGPCMEIPVALEITRQLAKGLKAVHDAGWLHRDIKPANCVVDLSEGEPVVTIVDFGIAGPQANFCPNWFSGTPAYASPEQIRSEPLDPRSDLYSLGATLFFILTGRTPYLYDDLIQRFRGPGVAPAISLAKASAMPFPDELEQLVADLLSHDRDRRPRDADELCARLEQIGGTPASSDAPEAHFEDLEVPTIVGLRKNETVQGAPLRAMLEVYVDAMLDEELSEAESEDELLVLWGSADASRPRPFSVDAHGVVYAADERCVVSTDRAGQPRSISRGGRHDADISALASCNDAVWTGTDDGWVIVSVGDDSWESRHPSGAAIEQIEVTEDGRMGIVRGADGTAFLCRDYGRKWWIELGRDATTVALSRDGRRFAIASGLRVEIGSVGFDEWKMVSHFECTIPASSIAFLGDELVAVCDERGAIWTYAMRDKNTPRAHFLLPLDQSVSIAANGDKLLACSCDESGYVVVRDVTPGVSRGWVMFS